MNDWTYFEELNEIRMKFQTKTIDIIINTVAKYSC